MTVVVEDWAHRPVDVGGQVWLLNEPGRMRKIDWRIYDLAPRVETAARAYARHLIATMSPGTVMGFEHALRGLSRHRNPCTDPAGNLDPGFVGILLRVGVDARAVAALRSFYRWAADSGHEGFTWSVARRITKIIIPRSTPASSAPSTVPLTVNERAMLVERLAQAGPDALPWTGRVALMFCLAWGPNAAPPAAGRVDDYVPGVEGEDPVVQITRQKKGLPARADFRDRDVFEAALRESIETLVAENIERARTIAWPDGTVGVPRGVAIPLFMRDQPFLPHVDPDHPMHAWAMHMSAYAFGHLIERSVAAICPELSRVGVRRLRHTLASHLVATGVSAYAVADLLDHRSGASVVMKVYGKDGLRPGEHLDRALSRGPYRDGIAALESGLGRL